MLLFARTRFPAMAPILPPRSYFRRLTNAPYIEPRTFHPYQQQSAQLGIFINFWIDSFPFSLEERYLAGFKRAGRFSELKPGRGSSRYVGDMGNSQHCTSLI